MSLQLKTAEINILNEPLHLSKDCQIRKTKTGTIFFIETKHVTTSEIWIESGQSGENMSLRENVKFLSRNAAAFLWECLLFFPLSIFFLSKCLHIFYRWRDRRVNVQAVKRETGFWRERWEKIASRPNIHCLPM